ncbi:C-glycoside deglycosidase beta subunit domain-containing protein [Salinactinospora qingdaonensis]|uniref:C-deglycosylation enzyme beta subunit n=1 Tax=Salinactinospora qingdaonensis TaxID=702744 RepID=A0ABP7GAA8_9ACTN
MIPDRIIEAGTLSTDGSRTSVEVRIPWYRALPGSCIDDAALTVDGVTAPAESVRWEMNGRTYALPELVERTDEWWFPLDSAVLSGDLPANPGTRHEVTVELKLYIPYIVTDHGVLRIEERDSKTMEVRQR